MCSQYYTIIGSSVQNHHHFFVAIIVVAVNGPKSLNRTLKYIQILVSNRMSVWRSEERTGAVRLYGDQKQKKNKPGNFQCENHTAE